MIKRTAAALFWFVAITWAYNYVGYYLAMPFLVGPLVAAVVSAFVAFDPLSAVWPEDRKASRPLTPTQGILGATVEASS